MDNPLVNLIKIGVALLLLWIGYEHGKEWAERKREEDGQG